jgi:hypothetical protein
VSDRVHRAHWANVVSSRGLVIVTGLLGVGFLAGYIVHRQQIQPYFLIEAAHDRVNQSSSVSRIRQWLSGHDRPDGYWRMVKKKPRLTESQQKEIEKLASIGYLAGTRKGLALGGVSRYDAELAFDGVNLYCSGHGPEAILMDMEGRVLHSWRKSFDEAFPDSPPPAVDSLSTSHWWRRVHLYPNGDLLAIFDGLGLIKIDANSKLLWAARNESHHDLEVGENGEIYVLTRTAHMIPDIDERRPILEDFITVLGPDGVEIRRYSVLDALRNSDFSTLLERSPGHGDLLHTNTLEILDGRHQGRSPLFKKGNVLISIPKLDTVAIVDLEVNRVVWALTGLFRFQHDPTFLDNGNVLIFDNGSEQSRVLEVNPLTQEVAWVYAGDTEESLYSEFCGASSRLPNGNTLITESEGGRAFEVTRDHRIVWEFRTPHQAGENGEFIASLMELKRLPETDFPFLN